MIIIIYFDDFICKSCLNVVTKKGRYSLFTLKSKNPGQFLIIFLYGFY